MKDLVIIVLILILGFGVCKNFENGRYAIIDTNAGVILLDKQQGFSWQKIHIADADYWKELSFYGDLEDNVPKGKEKEHKKLQKRLLK